MVHEANNLAPPPVHPKLFGQLPQLMAGVSLFPHMHMVAPSQNQQRSRHAHQKCYSFMDVAVELHDVTW